MNIDHMRIDNDTFVVLTDKGEEITYKNNSNADDLDIFGYLFCQNEIEARMKNVIEYYYEKKHTKIELFALKASLKKIKKLQKMIKSELVTIDKNKNDLNDIKNSIGIEEVSREYHIGKKQLVRKI